MNNKSTINLDLENESTMPGQSITSTVGNIVFKDRPLIGFAGMGWIGKNYCQNFKDRGYNVISYSIEEPHINNKGKIRDCDIVFIAVPTPTTPQGFNYDAIKEVLKLVGAGKMAVIKSTILPGVTKILQKEYKDIYVLHSPEFLTEATAAYDSANPHRNIIGIPVNNGIFRQKAKEVMDILPYASYQLICDSDEASFIKYGGNCWFYFKVVFINLLYDLVEKYPNCKWETIRDAMAADYRIGRTHLDPVHKTGRGAGGACFVKDMEAFRRLFSKRTGDDAGRHVLDEIVNRNLKYLKKSNKDQDIVKGAYG